MAGKRSIQVEINIRLKELRKRIATDEWREPIRELGKRKDPLADILLLHLLEHRSEVVREEAVEALEKLGGLLARIGVRAALGDPEYSVRNAAVEALGCIGNRRDVPRLLQALEDPEMIVRCSAAESLGYIGGLRAQRALLKVLVQDPEPGVRMWAAGAVGEWEDASVAPPLEEALSQETDHWVRSALVRTLYRLGQRPLAAYLTCLQDDDFMVCCQTLNWMPEEVRSEDRAAVTSAVRPFLQAEIPAVRGSAEEALQRLLKSAEREAV